MFQCVGSKLQNFISLIRLKQQFLVKYHIIFYSILRRKTYYSNLSVMASKCFKGNNDHYNGITIDSNEESCTPQVFAHRLTGM